MEPQTKVWLLLLLVGFVAATLGFAYGAGISAKWLAIGAGLAAAIIFAWRRRKHLP